MPRRGKEGTVVQVFCLFSESGKRNSTVTLESWKTLSGKIHTNSVVPGGGENYTGVDFSVKDQQSRGSYKINSTLQYNANYTLHIDFKHAITFDANTEEFCDCFSDLFSLYWLAYLPKRRVCSANNHVVNYPISFWHER